ncbi:hypothetical protein IVB15_11705 [Bradyrhizobium sp. 182]|uniref:hypothetical protein n=1 Tax=unclassified Bradyrhizobium TaxID=2631580 RepID=UPI001FFA3197|nr:MULTISPECIES: hypothetical protein [unclassified Bradyrhizobium]MCK1420328.1 hypothetical protein [Bradyrhizobium sp. CW12]MCK1528375.1 hypothetical protein [Bradyrhizobium sp. 182]MCK1615146.1 hypothetical protein [Bradyrhizobium sp. 159]MCK1649372.1 hypothetical protein [Bradyrhizobium sp. 154]MCK1666553.1 hypothetical protein [Bradyrhizobium sp. 153]
MVDLVAETRRNRSADRSLSTRWRREAVGIGWRVFLIPQPENDGRLTAGWPSEGALSAVPFARRAACVELHRSLLLNGVMTVTVQNADQKHLVFNVPLAFLNVAHQVFELVSEVQIHNNTPDVNIAYGRHYERHRLNQRLSFKR